MHFNPAVAKHATVDEYIAAIPAPLREVAAQARAVVDAELEGSSSAKASGAAPRSTIPPAASRPRAR